MLNLHKYQAKICLIAVGLCVVDGKALLIKHKKIGQWMCPGGHIDENEPPHLAAEREFFEETGVRAKAVGVGPTGEECDFLPLPVISNLHWISRQNYQARLGKKARGKLVQPDHNWRHGCEQHLSFAYLLQPTSKKLTPVLNKKECLDVGWFSTKEIKKLKEMSADIRREILWAMKAADVNN